MPKITVVWKAKRNHNLSICANGTEFICRLNYGITCETTMSVGYSSPNGARIDSVVERSGLTEDEVLKHIADKLDLYFETMNTQHDDDYGFLRHLLELCKVANKAYNELL